MNESKPTISHIFVDFDYTIYDTKNKDYIMSTVEALALAHKNGTKVILVTSKSVPTLHELEFFDYLPFVDGYLCTSMGYGKYGDEIIYDSPISSEVLLKCSSKIAEVSNKHQSDVCFQFIYSKIGEDKISKITYSLSESVPFEANKYAEDWNDKLGKSWDDKIGFGEEPLQKWFSDKKVYAIMVFAKKEIKEELEKYFNEPFGTNKLHPKPFGDTLLNVTAKKSNKKQWFADFTQDFGITTNMCLAIGDGEADIDGLDNCIAVISDNQMSNAAAYLDNNENKFKFHAKAHLNSEDIFNIFDEIGLISADDNDCNVKGLLSKDIEDGTLSKIGFVDCTNKSNKSIDNWLTINDVYFLGVNGYSKVIDNNNFNNFVKLEEWIKQSKDTGQKIKVLLMDPRSPRFKELINKINDYRILETYRKAYDNWIKLASTEGNDVLDLRFYSSPLPLFIKGVGDESVALSRFSDEPESTDTTIKKEPAFRICGKDNQFLINVFEYYNVKFDGDNVRKFNKKERKSLERAYKSQINKKEKSLKTILCCYSSSDKPKVTKMMEQLKKWNCSPIDYQRNDYGSKWKDTIRECMKNCSATFFFLNDDVFDLSKKDNYLREELLEFKNQNLIKKGKYLLISMNNSDLKEKFEKLIKENNSDLKEKFGKLIKENNSKFKDYYSNLNSKGKNSHGKVYKKASDFYSESTPLFIKKEIKKSKRIDLESIDDIKNSDTISDKKKTVSYTSNLLEIGLRRVIDGKINYQNIFSKIGDPSVDVKICSISEFTLSANHLILLLLLNRRKQNAHSLDKNKKVKILLLDPTSKAFTQMLDNLTNGDGKEQEKIEKDLKTAIDHINSMKIWLALAEKPEFKDLLDIRVYNGGQQLFKIYSASDSYMTVQPYKNTKIGQGKAKIDYPTLIIQKGNNTKPNALFSIFDKMFDDMFNSDKYSRSIREVSGYIKSLARDNQQFNLGEYVDIRNFVREKERSTPTYIWARKTKNIGVRDFTSDSFISYSSGVQESYFNDKDYRKSKYFVATKLDDNNEPVIRDGSKTEWIISKERLEKKYEKSSECEDIYIPKKELVEKFIQIDKDLEFIVNNNTSMRVASGGYINVTNGDEYYGVSESDFLDTYEIVEAPKVEEKAEKHITKKTKKNSKKKKSKN